MNAFVGTELTEHIAFSPEGYLICRNVPIARSGWQSYKGRELAPELEPERTYRVWRDAREVFSKAAMASAEGKAIVSPHPPLMLDANNTRDFAKGHCQNVRRDGDLLVADLIITDALLTEEILSGRLREVSCGYSCRYTPLGGGGEDEFAQQDIRVNHVACIPSGRAGGRVAIQDGGSMNKELSEALDQLRQTVVLCEDVIKANKLRKDARAIEASGKRTEELTRHSSGIGAIEFHERLAAENAAYRAHDEQAKAGQAFSDACKAAGRKMADKQLAFARCTDSAAPIKPHVDADLAAAEDFCALTRAAGARMRGEQV